MLYAVINKNDLDAVNKHQLYFVITISTYGYPKYAKSPLIH